MSPRPPSNLIDVEFNEDTGYPLIQAREDTRENMMGWALEAGATVTEFSDAWWIEPNRWAEIAAYNTENRLWGMNYLDRFTNQNPTHECTCHMLRACFEGARNRQRRLSFPGPSAGKQLPESSLPEAASVWVSALSVYAEANPRQWGGAGCRQVLSIAIRRGFLPDKKQPKDWGFKHYLQGTAGAGNITQSKGNFIRVEQFPEGWEKTANLLKAREVIFPASVEEHICLLLHGLVVGVGRNGHAVPHAMYDVEQKLAPYPDSYDLIRYDSWSNIRKTVGGSLAIVSVDTPDDWLKPADHNLTVVA